MRKSNPQKLNSRPYDSTLANQGSRAKREVLISRLYDSTLANQGSRAKREVLIVILGQTASGKSELAIGLALRLSSGQAKKQFGINGAEIISADSRQVYKGMDIGTGKVRKKEMRGVPHHLLDVASPKRRFTVAQYRKLAFRAINKIFKKGRIPILCGGTGFYIQAVVDGIVIPGVSPDWKLRKKMEKKSVKELHQILKKLDPKRAKNIDRYNPRRLIRAIEIVIKTGEPVPPLKKFAWTHSHCRSPKGEGALFACLMIGIKKSPRELKELIQRRLLERVKKGMIAEVKRLRKSGLSWKRLEEFGLEYRWIARYLQEKITYDQMVECLQKDIEKFAKRQMTWFKRDKHIYWVRKYREAEVLVQLFLKGRVGGEKPSVSRHTSTGNLV